jgi:DNA processing protein
LKILRIGKRNFISATLRVRALSIHDADYPQRLLTAYDAPVLLYYKGNADLNPRHVISIVGTRRNSDYGKQLTEKIIQTHAL